MPRSQTILAVIVGAVLVIGATVIVWPALSALSFIPGALVPAIIMIIGCVAIGGALMFLLFWSARKGRDEEVYLAAVDDHPETPPDDTAKR